jgi:hypothetical protein
VLPDERAPLFSSGCYGDDVVFVNSIVFTQQVLSGGLGGGGGLNLMRLPNQHRELSANG